MPTENILQSPILANAINILCEEAHVNAKSKGWWDESPDTMSLKEFITDSFDAYGAEIKPE